MRSYEASVVPSPFGERPGSFSSTTCTEGSNSGAVTAARAASSSGATVHRVSTDARGVSIAMWYRDQRPSVATAIASGTGGSSAGPTIQATSRRPRATADDSRKTAALYLICFGSTDRTNFQ
jgi:hypothetical protein